MRTTELLEPRRLLAVSDPAFGDDGVTVLPSANTTASIVTQADGKTLVGIRQGADNAFIARLNSDGSVDTSFGGGDGIAPLAVADDPDNSVLIAQITLHNGSPLALLSVPSENRLALLRFTPAGALDSTFGDAGRVQVSDEFAANIAAVRALANGDISVAAATEGDLLFARYHADGTPDTTLGPEGTK